MRNRLTACLLIAISILATSASADEARTGEAASAHERDVETLRKAILRSAEAFNASDPKAIMAPYARDIVLTYPGIPDMGYDELVKAYDEMTAPRPGVKARTSPEIEEILVSGDLGIIRITWTTTTTETNPPREWTRRMRDLQVWRRESDGTWKFARGMHFRIPEEEPKEAPPS